MFEAEGIYSESGKSIPDTILKNETNGLEVWYEQALIIPALEQHDPVLNAEKRVDRV